MPIKSINHYTQPSECMVEAINRKAVCRNKMVTEPLHTWREAEGTGAEALIFS